MATTLVADKAAGGAPEKLVVQSCRYHAKGKVLLDNIAFECAPGQLLGVLGPSGAGKSVLLDLLTFSAATPKDGMMGKKTGDAVPRNLLQADVTHGGERLCNISDFSRHCAFVPCVDSQYPTLTCKQALTHTAEILSNDSKEQIEDRVQALIDLLGLTTCADTKVGGYVGMKGMSGGQKKRLALGLALLREPKVLYVDEPTSGLDSAAAYHVMKVVKDLAHKFDLCVVCTLQQPPSNVFAMLDNVLVLSSGKVAYAGERRHMLPYFEKISKISCPAASNPPDFVLDLVNPALSTEKRLQKGLDVSVQELLSIWVSEKGQSQMRTLKSQMPSSSTLSTDAVSSDVAELSDRSGDDNKMQLRASLVSLDDSVYEKALKLVPRLTKPTKMSRLKAVFAREGRIAVTDPVLYILRPFIMWFTNIFMIALWWEGRGHDNKYVMSKIWPLFMIMTSNSIYSIVCVYFFKSTFPIVSQEVRNGYYSAFDYILAIVLLSIPVHLVLAFISMYGAMYLPGFGGWHMEPSGWGFVTQFMLIQVFDACARVCAMSGPLIIGMGGMIQFWYASFLFCGMFLDQDLVPWPFRAFTYMSPHRHAVAIFLYSDFEHEKNFHSAEICPVGDTRAGCTYPHGPAKQGFICPDAGTEYKCWGSTGEQVLTSLKPFYAAVDDEDNMLMRLLIIVAISAYFSIAHGVMFYMNCWSSGKVSLPGEGISAADGKSEKELDVVPVDPEKPSIPAAGYPVGEERIMSKTQEVQDFNASNVNRFECFQLTVDIKSKNPEQAKRIVNKVGMKASGGQVFAMLGPSGAGKTTWLDAVTFNLAGNLEMEGCLYVNGREVKHMKDLQSDTVYVPQYVQVIPTLTCRENLEFTAKLVMGETQLIGEKVESMLVAMGLKDCEHEKAGGLLGNSGMTAGQKKRLSVACGLLREPRIIFLDEPTTGIDSASAYLMMYYLKQIAQLKNMVVVCTIHQPSYEIWSLCDQVAILASGEMAYCGPRPSIGQHFSKIGYPVPPLTNPAEYYLDLVNSDFASKEQQQALIAGFQNSAEPLGTYDADAGKEREGRLRAPGACALLTTLFQRELYVTILRDPTCYLGRMGLYMGSSIFFDIAYAGHFEWNQRNVMSKAWLMGWIFCAQTLFAASATVYYSFAFKLVRNEIRNGFYSHWMYLSAMTLISIPMCVVLAMCVLWIPTYWLGNMYWEADNVLMTIVNLSVYYIAFEWYAQMASVISDNILVGLLAMIVYWYNSFLFCGLMVNIDEIWWPMKAFTYIMPTRWGLANQMYIEFAWTDRTIPGATAAFCPVYNNPLLSASTMPTLAAFQADLDARPCHYDLDGKDAPGFTCAFENQEPGLDVATECFAFTGNQVLKRLNSLAFKTFEDENNVGLFLLLVFLIGLSNKMGHLFFFLKKVRYSPKLSAPGTMVASSQGTKEAVEAK
eukprot:CAMPEP_0178991084 /NCGR_PEP_ID=MMETSP0795-20121207/5323_1 /TAXON_ID=88552 /ORGANISM="Amoebophrya sp., Strain Ameob2" /LENGTH=1425 /DNA_ID=CAMNT_0020682737 /DNA_START=681 /DNA_END=4958 /DNA_ORIENTATION=+